MRRSFGQSGAFVNSPGIVCKDKFVGANTHRPRERAHEKTGECFGPCRGVLTQRPKEAFGRKERKDRCSGSAKKKDLRDRENHSWAA